MWLLAHLRTCTPAILTHQRHCSMISRDREQEMLQPYVDFVIATYFPEIQTSFDDPQQVYV
jgi:hypothetical protein